MHDVFRRKRERPSIVTVTIWKRKRPMGSCPDFPTGQSKPLLKQEFEVSMSTGTDYRNLHEG